VVGVAPEASVAGVDAESALGAGAADCVLSAFDFEASLDDPPEQAPPSRASVLNRAT
jgi:hypothetical protein